MGYYTAYGLNMFGDPEKVKAAEHDLLEISKDKNGKYDGDVRELIDIGGCYAKLYDLPEWIAKIASNHPDVLIVLSGDGEESDDLWEERWKGDKEEFHKTESPPFTELKLPNEK